MKKKECPGLEKGLLGPDEPETLEGELRLGEGVEDVCGKAKIVGPYDIPQVYREGRQYDAYPEGIVSPDGWGCSF